MGDVTNTTHGDIMVMLAKVSVLLFAHAGAVVGDVGAIDVVDSVVMLMMSVAAEVR